MEVKPLSPADVAAKVTPNKKRLASLFGQVNEALLQGADSAGTSSSQHWIATSVLGSTQAEREAVAAAFRQRGWQVTYCSDQRDGSYYAFTPARGQV